MKFDIFVNFIFLKNEKYKFSFFIFQYHDDTKRTRIRDDLFYSSGNQVLKDKNDMRMEGFGINNKIWGSARGSALPP